MLGQDDTDDVLEALAAVVHALKVNRVRIAGALDRADQIREQRLAGWTYTHIVENAEGPLLVELLTANLLALHRVGHELRAAEAKALRQEGLSTTRIAQLFRVSRQRVTALLLPTTRDAMGESSRDPSDPDDTQLEQCS